MAAPAGNEPEVKTPPVEPAEVTPPESTPDKPPAPTEGDTPTEDGKTAAASDTVPKEPAPKQHDGGWQRRIDRLTREKRDLERQNWDLERKLRESANPAAGDQRDPDAEPQETDFDKNSEYVKALGAWSGRRAFREEQERVRAAENQRQINQRLASAREAHEDFDEVALRDDITLPPAVIRAVQESENTGHLMYYFGSNPEEADRLMAIQSPYKQLRELAKIEDSLSKAPEAPKPKVKASGAPAPIKPINEANGFTAPFDLNSPPGHPGWKKWQQDRNKAEAKRLGYSA